MSARLPVPITWQHMELVPVAFRACYRCSHGAEQGIERVCVHPELLVLGTPQPVAVLRHWGGLCGPNANFMSDPALASA